MLKQMVESCRSLRSEMELSPAERVAGLIATGERPGGGGGVGALLDYLKALARLSEARIVDEFPLTDSPTQVVHPLRIMLDVKVDAAAERARIARERSRVEGEAAKSEARLANHGFVARAPAAVVEQERARLAAFRATLEKLKAQQARLSG
jgi:valyl-tRNA synthetase